MFSLFVGGLLWLPLAKCLKDREALLALTIAKAHQEADYLLKKIEVSEWFQNSLME